MALRALALSSGIAASTTLFGLQILAGWGRDFGRANRLAWPLRRDALLCMGIATLVVALGAIVWMWRRGDIGIRQIHRLSQRCAPAILLGAVPALVRPKAWDPLTTAVAISAFVLLAERTFRVRLAAANPGAPTDTAAGSWSSGFAPAGHRIHAAVRRWGPVAIVVGGAIFYAVYMSIFTIWSHRRFGTYNYDLGQYDNIFWSTLHGKPLRCSPLNLNANWGELRNHAELSVLLLVPFYAIRPGAETSAHHPGDDPRPGRDSDLSVRGPAPAPIVRPVLGACVPPVPTAARGKFL